MNRAVSTIRPCRIIKIRCKSRETPDDREPSGSLPQPTLAGVYLQKGDTDNALTYLGQALPLREKLNNPEYLARTLDSLGDAMWQWATSIKLSNPC